MTPTHSQTLNRPATLGDRVRDRVSGFTGIATSHARHLTGCDRLWVEPAVDSTGKRGEGMWLDIDMAQIVEAAVLTPVTYDQPAPGGTNLPAPR